MNENPFKIEGCPMTEAVRVLREAVERRCSMNCDAESSCLCAAHEMYRVVLPLLEQPATKDDENALSRSRNEALRSDDRIPAESATSDVPLMSGTDLDRKVDAEQSVNTFGTPAVLAQHVLHLIDEKYRIAATLYRTRDRLQKLERLEQPALPAARAQTEPKIDHIWRSKDRRDEERRVRVVHVSASRIGYRNCETGRLAYAGPLTFRKLFEAYSRPLPACEGAEPRG